MYIYGYDEVNGGTGGAWTQRTLTYKNTTNTILPVSIRVEARLTGGSSAVIREYIEPTPRRGGVLVA